jgi:glutaconate CoA-transferase subunit B
MVLPTRRADVCCLGGAQVDKYGNLNSTCIGDYLKPKVRLPGSGGACDFAVMGKRTLIIMEHDKRRFAEKVDYITSPGWKCKKFPENTMVFREELGLWGGPDAVISTLGVMRFHPKTHEMYAESFFADLGVTPEKIASNTGFAIDVSKALPCLPPTYKELDLLRNKIDKEGFFIPRR